MRSFASRGLVSRKMASWLLSVAAAALLAGCSNSIERFAAEYQNPSDTDPVYTASVPKKVKKKKIVADDYASNGGYPDSDDIIEESPVKKAVLPKKSPSYEYEDAYKKTYKQPQLKKPKLALEEDVAVVEEPVDVPAPKKIRKQVPFEQAEETYTPPVFKPKKKIAPVEEVDTAVIEKPVLSKSKKQGSVHTVSNGETLFSLGRTYGVSPYAIAELNGLTQDDRLKIGQQINIPGVSAAKVAKKPTVVEEPDVANAEIAEPPKKLPKVQKKAPLSLAEEQDLDTTPPPEEKVAEVKPIKKKIVEKKPEIKVAEAEPEEKVVEKPAAVLPAAGSLSLRWPLKGKVISSFGPKSNGLKNEGINIAVPEGTSIRAADAGVVAYAGSELKGYGNLVLIRHAGGYVTAYAHAKELLVKKGDTIKRGDIIAKAGQTGAVSSPQLHFEVRKGATALDPMKHLTSATASN